MTQSELATKMQIMNVNIEKQEIVQQDDKFILSVSFNDNRNVIGLPSMTINELNEIKNNFDKNNFCKINLQLSFRKKSLGF